MYAGSELLSRVPMVKWNTDLDKELLNAVEAHLKEPYQLIYSSKPLLAFVLLIEFLEKLANRTALHKNKCRILATRLRSMGGIFVREIMDEEELKFFVEQEDSRGRSALMIMSMNKCYEMLESH